MSIFAGHSLKTIRAALLVCSAIQVAGCMSDEDRARNYYDRGMKLFSEHDNAKAAIELARLGGRLA